MPVTKSGSMRPSLAAALAAGLLLVPAFLVLSPAADLVSDALVRMDTRSAQLLSARQILSERPQLNQLATTLKQELDEGSLFHRGQDIPSIEASLLSSVRATVQQSGAVIRVLDSKTEADEGKRRRLTIKLTAEGAADTLDAAIGRLEEARPRLLLRFLHMHGPSVSQGALSAPILTLELEIDAYVDLSAS